MNHRDGAADGEEDDALSMPGVESTSIQNNLVLLGDTA